MKLHASHTELAQNCFLHGFHRVNFGEVSTPNRSILRVILVVCVASFAATGAAHAVPSDHAEVVDSASYLLRDSTRTYRNGRHIRLLLALRHLRDPELTPLFATAADANEISLKVHGILGLAESHAQKHLDLERIATLEDKRYQALVVSEAMDRKLLSNDQATQLLNWPKLDVGVRLVVAAQLQQAGKLNKPSLLEEGVASSNLAQQSLAYLLLAQRGKTDGLAGLERLSQSTRPERDEVRLMVITTALRYEMGAVGNWAASIAAEPKVSRRLGLAALEAALRFDADHAADLWKQQMAAADEPDQLRLARLALAVAPWCDAQVFAAMLSQENPLLQEMGRAGLAIAEERGVAERIVTLVRRDPPNSIINGWAMRYAGRDAEPAVREAILRAVIETYADGPERGRIQRLDDALSATTILANNDMPAAIRVLQPMLVDEDADEQLVHAILMGLLSSKADHPEQVIDGLPPFADRRARSFALLLRARHADKLSDDDLAELGLIVRGGPIADPMLRVQAAWVYLRLTGQTDAVLADVLGG